MVRLVAWDNCTCLAALTFKKLMVTLCRLLLVIICPYKICVPMGWVGPPFAATLFNEFLGSLGGPPFPINQPCFPLGVLPIRPTLMPPFERWSYHRGHIPDVTYAAGFSGCHMLFLSVLAVQVWLSGARLAPLSVSLAYVFHFYLPWD